jgi:HEAT repeat protein
VLAVGLFALRVGREHHERRTATRHRHVRQVLLTALMGEPEDAARARADLRRRTGSQWAAVEEQAFAMIPKVKGESRDALVTLLLSRGAAVRAGELARARSQVRRARAAYRLGGLAQPDTVSVLLGLLRDPAFVVRRMTVRALGQVGDPLAVPPLLDASTADPRLTRDVLAAVTRIGPAAAGALRRELRHALDVPAENRRASLIAMGLGLLADVAAVPLLVEALADRRQPGLAEAAAEALGSVGAPSAVEPLLRAAHEERAALRAAAATAIGAIGDECAAESLVSALAGGDHRASRAVAGALLRLGDPGRRALEAAGSPYALEALAVDAVRQSV